VFLAGMFLFVPSDTFAVTFSHKTYRKRVKENAKVSFFETDNQARTGRVLFTDFVDFGQSRLSGLSLGEFIIKLYC